MKTLVTGAAGFVGSHLVNALTSAGGYEVVAVDSFTDYYDPAEKRANVATFDDDVVLDERPIELIDWQEALADVEVVFHLAGQPGVRSSWGTEFSTYTERNILATQRILEGARSSTSIRRIVYASSSSVYGNAKSYPVSEATITEPRSPYGVTKLAAEHLCSLYANNFGLPTVSLRFFTVYGPRQRPDMAFRRFIESTLKDEPLQVYGDGHQVREFTFVSDIVDACMRAASADVPPGLVANLSGGSSVSVREVIATLEEIHGSRVSVDYGLPVPGDVLKTGGTTEIARRFLSWTPKVPLVEGLRSEYDWLTGRVSRSV